MSISTERSPCLTNIHEVNRKTPSFFKITNKLKKIVRQPSLFLVHWINMKTLTILTNETTTLYCLSTQVIPFVDIVFSTLDDYVTVSYLTVLGIDFANCTTNPYFHKHIILFMHALRNCLNNYYYKNMTWFLWVSS